MIEKEYSQIVKSPGLPNNCAVLAVGEAYRECLEPGFRKLGVECIGIPGNSGIDKRLEYHADLSMIHVMGIIVGCSSNISGSKLEAFLKDAGFLIVEPESQPGHSYPEDAVLNISMLGNHLIYNEKTASKRIIGLFDGKPEYTHVKVKQGYAGCSICRIDNNSLITADRGIYTSAVQNGIDALLISEGFISLPGFNYGFIGGASIKISEHKIAFTGLLDSHPDKNRIEDFIRAHDIEIEYLTDMNAFDIGGAVQLLEKP